MLRLDKLLVSLIGINDSVIVRLLLYTQTL